MSDPREGAFCGSCLFFGTPAPEDRANRGSCRRYAPRGPVVDFNTATGIDYFPPVRAHDWCGEYQPLNPKASQ